MRPLCLSMLSVIFLYPSLKRSGTKNRQPIPRVAEFALRLHAAGKEIIEITRGTHYRRPTVTSLIISALAVFVVLWSAGSSPVFAVILGGVASLMILLRRSQIAKARSDELASFWPDHLDQVRSKMMTSSRALSYVFYDESFAGSHFLQDLLDQGRREFENSGDLEKSFQTIWRYAADETTDHVCSSLCETMDATSFQLEQQLTLLATVLRDRNALQHEADSRLAGVRTARAFIVIIPFGMALAGLSFAGSPAPFLSKASLIQIAIALVILGVCWTWSSKLMSFPKIPTRKFPSDHSLTKTPT